MKQDEFNTDFEASLAVTCFLTGGVLVDPRTVGIRLSEEAAVKTLPFEMRIGAMLLAHELEQAGVELGAMTLEEFVKADVRDQGETALQGYLGIVQADRMPKVKRGFMGLFGKRPIVPAVSLWIRRIAKIYTESEVLVISGEAVESTSYPTSFSNRV